MTMDLGRFLESLKLTIQHAGLQNLAAIVRARQYTKQIK